MKINIKMFCKSFLLAFLVFGIISAIIITSLYIDSNAINPNNEETTILLGVTNGDKIISLCLVNCKPQNESISFLPIPDNVWLDNGSVLQNQYNKNNISDMKSSLENIVGVKINRYIIFSVDNLSEINSKMGHFAMTPLYPFEHNGEMKAGTLNMNAELVKSMFTYSDYDLSEVSMSNIGVSYLKTFLDIYTKPTYIDKLSEVLSEKSFLRGTNTNITSDEMKEYCELLSKYGSMKQNQLELSGKYDTQPHSSKYFIPDNSAKNKNIFK